MGMTLEEYESNDLMAENEFLRKQLAEALKHRRMFEADYENRLKADMVAMLEDLDLQIDESATYNLKVAKVQRLIRNKIDKLKREDLPHCQYTDAEIAKSFIEDVEAVKDQLPTTKNNLGVDWESYKDVDGNSLDDLILEVLQNNFDCGNTYGYKVADEIIDLLPSVTSQEQKTGYWKTRPLITFCSECGFELKIDNTNYCPNCGAKMDEPRESEET